MLKTYQFYVGTPYKPRLIGAHRVMHHGAHVRLPDHQLYSPLLPPLGAVSEASPSDGETNLNKLIHLLQSDPILVQVLADYLQKHTQNTKTTSEQHNCCCAVHKPIVNNPNVTNMPNPKGQQSGKGAKSTSTRGRNKGSTTTGDIDLTSLTSNMRGRSATRTSSRRKKQAVDGANTSTTTKPDKVDTSGGTIPSAVTSPVPKKGSGRNKRQQVNQTPDKTPIKNNNIITVKI